MIVRLKNKMSDGVDLIKGRGDPREEIWKNLKSWR